MIYLLMFGRGAKRISICLEEDLIFSCPSTIRSTKRKYERVSYSQKVALHPQIDDEKKSNLTKTSATTIQFLYRNYEVLFLSSVPLANLRNENEKENERCRGRVSDARQKCKPCLITTT